MHALCCSSQSVALGPSRADRENVIYMYMYMYIVATLDLLFSSSLSLLCMTSSSVIGLVNIFQLAFRGQASAVTNRFASRALCVDPSVHADPLQ